MRKSFVRTATDNPPPLADLYTLGGRGGTVAIKLYLALLWRCATAPYATNKPARGWAVLLDLEDPESRGARRIHAAAKTLASKGLVTITAQPGEPNIITLRQEDGSGGPYTLPSSSYSKAKAHGASQARLDRDVYFKIATELWTQGWIQQMSGAALVMLLILLAEQAGQGLEVWISPSEFAHRYKVSHNARSKGVTELRQLRLLEVARQPLAAYPAASTFERRRTRSIYRLVDLAVTDPPTS